MKWVIDGNQIVHVNICGDKAGPSTPYFPQRVVRTTGKPVLMPVTSAEEMFEHLARPDSSGGMITHTGPSMIHPCVECIPKP